MFESFIERLTEPSTLGGIGSVIAGGVMVYGGDYVTGVPLIVGGLGAIVKPEKKYDAQQIIAELNALSDSALRDRLRNTGR